MGEQDLAARDARLRLPAQVEHDLQQLRGIGPLMQRTVEVGRESLGEELDLGVPQR